MINPGYAGILFIASFKKILLRLFFSLAFIYVALCAWLYFSQRSLLYFPTPRTDGVEAQAFELQNDGLILKGWVTNPGKQRAMVYFGGNGEAVEYNAGLFENSLPEVTVYLLPYRSYGGNPGDVTEENLYRDALKLYDQINSRHESVAAMGRSLGSGVATYLASKRKIDKLILVTPYDSIVNVAQSHYPAFPVGLLIKDRFESWQRAPDIDSDVLVLVAGSDEIIPRSNTDNLVKYFKQKPRVIVFENTGHNTLSDSAVYEQAISGFVGK